MSIEAINEKLLRSIGVGVAVADLDALVVLFANEKFVEWFGVAGSQASLESALPGIDVAALRDAVSSTGRYAAELTVRPKRRSYAIALVASVVPGDGRRLLLIECQNVTRIRELEAMIESYSRMVEKNTRDLKREKERAERLLLNIMPRSVYDEFKTFGVTTPQRYDAVSVLLLDFVGFTEMSISSDPASLIGELNDIFTSFDRIAEQFGCERIKTMGDAYLAVCGMPERNPDHARTVAKVAMLFVRYLERRNESYPQKWLCRVGLSTGPAVGSVVGIQKYVYDIFGPSVNLAARMEAFAGPMEICVPDSMAAVLAGEFVFDDIGAHDVRGFGRMKIHRLLRESGPERS